MAVCVGVAVLVPGAGVWLGLGVVEGVLVGDSVELTLGIWDGVPVTVGEGVSVGLDVKVRVEVRVPGSVIAELVADWPKEV